MDHLAISTPILIGLSYGSLVAQNYAVNYSSRVEKLVLLSTFAHKTPYYEAIELSWSRALEIGGYSLMLDVMMPFVLSDNYFQNPLIPVELLKSARKEMIEAVSLRKLMEATEKRPDYRKELEKIKVSTLVIHGDSDTLFSVDLGRQVANSIPNALFVIIPRTGHTLNLESVDLVNAEVSKFLN
jgi:pimeloyl-ACP methyl ester carboxylesterase